LTLTSLAYARTSINRGGGCCPVWDECAVLCTTCWLEQNASIMFVDECNCKVDICIRRTCNSHAISWQIQCGIMSDTSSIMEFDLCIDTVTSSSTNNSVSMFGAFSESSASNDDNLQDGLHFRGTLRCGHATNLQINSADPTNQAPVSIAASAFVTDLQVVHWWARIQRLTSTTSTIGLYSDAAYMCLVEEECDTISACLGGLDFFKVMNQTSTGNSNRLAFDTVFVRVMYCQSCPPS